MPHFSHGGVMLPLSGIHFDDASAQVSASIGENPRTHSRTVDVGTSRIVDVHLLAIVDYVPDVVQ